MIIDASGSMQEAWTRVVDCCNDIMENYKNVRPITFSE